MEVPTLEPLWVESQIELREAHLSLIEFVTISLKMKEITPFMVNKSLFYKIVQYSHKLFILIEHPSQYFVLY